MLHLLRRSRGLRRLAIHRNGFDSTSLRAIVGGWRRRNTTLLTLELFVASPRERGRAALGHEQVAK